MQRGIIDLIQENKSRFYAGEIRNSYYDEPYAHRGCRQRTIIRDEAMDEVDALSLWRNLKN